MPSPHTPDALVVEAVRFGAGRHRLEGEFVYPENSLPVGAAVIAGPHPLLGGNMHNNVVRCLGDGLSRHGIVTLRFNYRGVGGSDDLAAFWHTSRSSVEADYQADLAAW